MYIYDIWGGYNSMDHVARYILDYFDSTLVEANLNQGYLVNIRTDGIAWGSVHQFDNRNRTN